MAGAARDDLLNLFNVLVGVEPPVPPVSSHVGDPSFAFPTEQCRLRNIKQRADIFRLIFPVILVKHSQIPQVSRHAI